MLLPPQPRARKVIVAETAVDAVVAPAAEVVADAIVVVTADVAVVEDTAVMVVAAEADARERLGT